MKTALLVGVLAFFGAYIGCAAGGSDPADLDGNAGQSGMATIGGAGGSSGSTNGGGGVTGSECTTPQNCDDSNPCTTDTCEQGSCSHSDNTATCADDNDECTADFCSGGICTHPATGMCKCKEGAECDDSNPCTDDACLNNKCEYTNNTAPCADDGNECRDDVCVSGVCQHPNKPMGAPCTSDVDACTDDVCNGAVCTHPDNGTCECEDATDCNDNNPCTSDDCVDRACMYTNNTAACVSDNNPCTDDVCATGTCTHPFNTAPCADESPAKPCTDDICAAGVCTHTNNTAPCADESPAFSCTDDVCAVGVCTHVDNDTCECIAAGDCDDSNSCTTDSCTTLGVCQHINNTNPCEAGDADTDDCTFDICGGGICSHPANGFCGVTGVPFTVNSFDSTTDWNNLVTSPDQRAMVVTGTPNLVNLGDGGYIATTNTLTIEMAVASMSGLSHLEVLFGASTGTPSMIDVGLYNGTAWTDRSLSTYSTAPTTAIAINTTITVNTLDFGVPLGQITKVRLVLKPTGGEKVFRLGNIAAAL